MLQLTPYFSPLPLYHCPDVRSYTAAVWFDGLCQLCTCFLSHGDKLELAVEMATPDARLGIRMMCGVTGALHALLPRSTRWKLSLYASHQLLVMGVVTHYALIMRTCGPLQQFFIDACAPFLLAFGAVRILVSPQAYRLGWPHRAGMSASATTAEN